LIWINLDLEFLTNIDGGVQETGMGPDRRLAATRTAS